uniref:Exostosin GT47 domain-containing protein n=1 Tax=Daucus carota subsp. sativus TaxID=79200 RepID=A0A164WBD8_DAUCS
MREIFKSNPSCLAFTLFGFLFLGLITVLFSAGHSNFILSFASLPSSTASSSSNSTSSRPNPDTALYPFFTDKKKQKAVEEMIKQLEAESLLRRGKTRDEKLEKIESGLARARALIKQAAASRLNRSRSSPLKDPDYVPHGDIYKNAYLFHRSYLLMEKRFKIYVYEEGEPPLFHYGPCKNIYAMEGLFLNFMEVDTRFRTYDPDQAHVFFLPFSVVMILEHLFHPVIRDKAVLGRVIGDYVRMISSKYPYWNRSLGADHFMLSCHDWHWKGKDEDILVYEEVPQDISYQEMMKKSKYCLCPSGYEVASPRIVEAIYAECVPVLISQSYIPPFSDVLNWDAFSIKVSVSDIPNLKKILMNISEEEYIEKYKRVKQVQQHFLVNDPPKRYDVFNMIIHSVWLRRLNLQILY